MGKHILSHGKTRFDGKCILSHGKTLPSPSTVCIGGRLDTHTSQICMKLRSRRIAQRRRLKSVEEARWAVSLERVLVYEHKF